MEAQAPRLSVQGPSPSVGRAESSALPRQPCPRARPLGAGPGRCRWIAAASAAAGAHGARGRRRCARSTRRASAAVAGRGTGAPPLGPRAAGEGAAGARFLWEWQPGVDVHYERAAPDSPAGPAFAVVMVHGFGAEGSYFEEQLRAVAGLGGAAYAVDLLGQGRSWPREDPAPTAGDESWGWGTALGDGFSSGLAFGEPVWLDQLRDFARHVVKEDRVYFLGNSVGGLLAVKVVAGMREDPRVCGLVLANASPFWGWTSEGFAPWDGRLPVPGWIRPVASLWFDSLRANIESLLGLVYASPGDAAVRPRLEALAARISGAAAHPMGPAAFASILLAPKQEPSVGDALDALAAARKPVLLLYGEEDPWIVPFWAKRAAARVSAGAGEYYAISPAGHCPHHEAPAAFNSVLLNWLQRVDCRGGADNPGPSAPAVGSRLSVLEEAPGGPRTFEVERRL